MIIKPNLAKVNSVKKHKNNGSNQANKNCFWLLLIFCFNALAVENEKIPSSLLAQVEEGNAEAAYFIATMFNEGSEFITRNPEQAKKWMLKAAELELPQAMYEIAAIFEFADEQYDQAMKWYLKASEFGHAAAMESIANHHINGLGSIQKNCLTAYQWYEKAIAKEQKVAFNDYIWSLATHADKKCRNPGKALLYYSNFIALLQTEMQQLPVYILDTGAAVYAAISDFNQAIKLQSLAVEKLRNKDKSSIYQERLERYKSRKSWVQTTDTSL